MYSFWKRKFYMNLCRLSSVLIGGMTKLTIENDTECEKWKRDDDTAFSAQKSIMPATREMVDQLIASDTVVIFSKTRCPYCRMAKEVFNKLQKKYTAVELDERDDADEIQSILGEMTGATTVPRVFVKGVCLGGGTDIKKLYDSGELQNKF